MEAICVLIFGDGSISVTTKSGIALPSLTTIMDIKIIIDRARTKVPIDDVVVKEYVFNFALRLGNEVFVLAGAIPNVQIHSLMKYIKSRKTKLTTKTILNDTH